MARKTKRSPTPQEQPVAAGLCTLDEVSLRRLDDLIAHMSERDQTPPMGRDEALSYVVAAMTYEVQKHPTVNIRRNAAQAALRPRGESIA